MSRFDEGNTVMDSMKRREFGRRIFEMAASLGLSSVSPGVLAALGVPLSACSDGSSADGAPTAPRAPGEDPALEPLPKKTPPGIRVALVGGGYGNAVAALRLTQAGIPVTLFEMGRIWNKRGSDGKVFCSLLSPDDRAMWFKNQTEAAVTQIGPLGTSLAVPMAAGVLDVKGPDAMRVFMGRGLGGGSLVNLANYVMPVRESLTRALPSVDPDAMYNVYYPRALATLRANTLPGDVLAADCYQYARVGIAAAASVGIDSQLQTTGYSYDYMRREIAGEVPRSALGGEAAFGNNYGKRSLDKTYYADAMGTGLFTVHGLSQVTQITRDSQGTGYVLRVRQIDTAGSVLSEDEHSFSHVFLGGGSIGTSELLVRARERGDLPDLNAAVGTDWGPNSDIFVGRDNRIEHPVGALQASVPGVGFHTRDHRGKPLFSMVIPFPLGVETWVSFNLVITDNPEAGYFKYDSTTDRVDLRWSLGQNDPAVVSTKSVFDRINKAFGSRYNTGMFGGGRDVGDRATYHPCGGCPLGKATDSYGRVVNYTGLYVTDGSLLPVSIGANPALTITALAERNLERILLEDFPTAKACAPLACPPTLDSTCKSPDDFANLPLLPHYVFLVWRPANVPQHAFNRTMFDQVLPRAVALSDDVRCSLIDADIDTIANTPRTRTDGALLAGMLSVRLGDDPAAVAFADDLRPYVAAVAGYLVERAEPVSYERYWRDGTRSPGLQIATLLRRKPGMTRDEYRAYWYCQGTPAALGLQPFWNYQRNFVQRAVTRDAPEYDGFTVLHMQHDEQVTDGFAFFNGNPFNALSAYLNTSQFVDYGTVEALPAREWIMRSRFWPEGT